MAISVVCSHCRSKLKAKDHLAGRVLECPKCKNPVRVNRPTNVDDVAASILSELKDSPPAYPPIEELPTVEEETLPSTVPVYRVASPPPTPQPMGNLHPCPDCNREVSKRAAQCPHCGCPLGSTQSARATSPFPAVVSAFVQAVRDLGYTINSLDKQNGRIVFKSGMSWFTFGQEFTLVIIDNGNGTCSCDGTSECKKQITDWGEGKRIIWKVKERSLAILAQQGLFDCLRSRSR